MSGGAKQFRTTATPRTEGTRQDQDDMVRQMINSPKLTNSTAARIYQSEGLLAAPLPIAAKGPQEGTRVVLPRPRLAGSLRLSRSRVRIAKCPART
ncbi:hypothetical protein RHECNPAF_12210067 [Rhizobium etli CNPAF512]|nr:hypothetical protein RHECNPAF_12210067 [Rhizobium etli CNPAF512]